MFSISINVIFIKTLQVRATNGSMCQAFVCVYVSVCVCVYEIWSQLFRKLISYFPNFHHLVIP